MTRRSKSFTIVSNRGKTMKTSKLYNFGSKYAKKSNIDNLHPLYLLNVKNIAIHAKNDATVFYLPKN